MKELSRKRILLCINGTEVGLMTLSDNETKVIKTCLSGSGNERYTFGVPKSAS